jgi:hypothetical protein
MPTGRIDEILAHLHELQAELEQEIDRLLQVKRDQFRYSLKQGKVRFEQGMKALQRHQRTGLWEYLRSARLGHLLTAPIIYSVFLPLALLDLMACLYQHSCFRIYGIPRVLRSDYVIIDRQHLDYLNTIEKLNCIYCGYANGLIEYLREISARTEQYWCPIKHARRSPDPHRFNNGFLDYGDAQGYREQVQRLRASIQELRP